MRCVAGRFFSKTEAILAVYGLKTNTGLSILVSMLVAPAEYAGAKKYLAGQSVAVGRFSLGYWFLKSLKIL